MSGFLASNFLRMSAMTSPSLPSEYHVMRNCVCAMADGDNNVSDADMAAIDIIWRTTIHSSRNLPLANLFFLSATSSSRRARRQSISLRWFWRPALRLGGDTAVTSVRICDCLKASVDHGETSVLTMPSSRPVLRRSDHVSGAGEQPAPARHLLCHSIRTCIRTE